MVRVQPGESDFVDHSPSPGFSPDFSGHKAFQMTAMVIHRIADGKIAERWHEGDFLGAMIQLGVVRHLLRRQNVRTKTDLRRK